jgi:hypothetical protein
MNLRQGILKSFDVGSYTATVQVAGSLAVWLAGVPVNRGIPQAEMVAGRRCALVFFDDANPGDAVLVAVYT